MFNYPVELETDNSGTVLVTIPDLPGAVTFGEDKADALARAVGALETKIITLMSRGQDIPVPSRADGRPCVTLPPLSAAKVGLYQAMRAQQLRKPEMARRLNIHLTQLGRLLDLRHKSHLDQIDNALRAVGKTLSVKISDAA